MTKQCITEHKIGYNYAVIEPRKKSLIPWNGWILDTDTDLTDHEHKDCVDYTEASAIGYSESG